MPQHRAEQQTSPRATPAQLIASPGALHSPALTQGSRVCQPRPNLRPASVLAERPRPQDLKIKREGGRGKICQSNYIEMNGSLKTCIPPQAMACALQHES